VYPGASIIAPGAAPIFMAKDPAVLFYTSDFLTGTSRLSDEQCGQYIRALCSQHQEGKFSKEELLALLKSYDSPVWKKFKQDEDGLFFNERMQIEIEKRVSYCESRSHKGESGRKSKSYDNHTISVRKSQGNHTDNGNEDEDNNKIINEIIDYLNLKCGSHYRTDTAGFISGRLKDGFTLDDFKKVIDKKCGQWLNDEKMQKFIRPKTLFSPEHFQEYLNEPNRTNFREGINSELSKYVGATAKSGEFGEGILTLDGVPCNR
jgi:uncharacterized phage protein (TIGR02220 family)